MHRIRTPIIAAAAVAGLGVSACSPDTADFKDEAQSLIEDEEQTAQSFGGLTFEDATCEEPANKDVNTTFTCSATASDGTAASFVVTITAEDSISVGYVGPGGEAPTTETTLAPPTS